MKNTKELEEIFEHANRLFLKNNIVLFETKVSERTLCGALMIELHEVLKNTRYFNYYVDVEYNRNIGGMVKTIKKTYRGMDECIVTINCDLIVHSRGKNKLRDNLIALEMKKSTGRKIDKDNDRIRLECLTKSPGQDIWSYGRKALPQYVCGYGLGVYYEVNFKRQSILVEYYKEGNCYYQYEMRIPN
ncbi:hypothetical protein DW974_08655 [Lachnospiraceae bacterium AM48-27BH]|nr:hypothetical protein DW974_08655 [Lachnospiraceae bacterium AM48-27BH]